LETLDAIADRPVRLGVLISGGGRSLINLMDCIAAGELKAEIPVVIASQSDCTGIGRATDAGLKCQVVQRRDYISTRVFSNTIFDQLRELNVDLVIMAGFLALLKIPDDFHRRVLNIHPSLIPAFSGRGYYGARVHEAAIERGVRISGCTVHFADNEYDHGPIILQTPVTVPDGATAAELAALVFEEEKRAYPEAIRRVTSGKLTIDGRRVRLLKQA